MKLYGALVLMVTLSAACGLECYVCAGKVCSDTLTCPPDSDRCFKAEINGVVSRGCIPNADCVGSINCCKEDLCNGAIPTGASVLVLLLSSAIFTVFL